MLSSLFGTILFAGSYILGDYLQTNANISPRDICIRVGSYYTLAIMIYILIYTVPNFKILVYDKVIQSNGKLSMILFVYILTVISQTIHGFAFFSCLGNVGAVSTGTVSGLRAIIVFFLSSYLFCSYKIFLYFINLYRRQASQCLTIYKEISSFMVLSGVGYYIYESSRTKPIKTIS